MPGKSGRSLIFCGKVLYAHSTISSKLLAMSVTRPTLPPGQAWRCGHATGRLPILYAERPFDFALGGKGELSHLKGEQMLAIIFTFFTVKLCLASRAAGPLGGVSVPMI